MKSKLVKTQGPRGYNNREMDKVKRRPEGLTAGFWVIKGIVKEADCQIAMSNSIYTKLFFTQGVNFHTTEVWKSMA